MNIDETDLEILAALRNDARLSNRSLADRVGLAPSSSLQRVRRLQLSGLLGPAHAEIDFAAMGFGLQAMVSVKLERHSRQAVEAFRDYVLGLDPVMSVYHVAGATDFLVHVLARDSDHLRDIAMEAFTSRAEVAHIETSIIFELRRNWTLPDRHSDRNRESQPVGE
ncbi:MAG: Lrp/AsnC family transcriptional regulator [Gammaproteobacteria bacterium]